MRRGFLRVLKAVAGVLPLLALSALLALPTLRASAQKRPAVAPETSRYVNDSTANAARRIKARARQAATYPEDSAANAARAVKARAQQAVPYQNDSAANAARAANAGAQRSVVEQRAPVVPRIVGMAIADARRAVIKALDAQLGNVTSQQTPDQALDSVVAAQIPAESTPYNRSQPVTATVWVYVAAKAPTVDSVVVPDVGKRRFTNARDILQDSGLRVEPSKLSIEELARAFVTGQTPPPYARVPRNSPVVLMLFVPAAQEPPPEPRPKTRVDSVSVPDITALTRMSAEKTIRDGSLQVGHVAAGPVAVLARVTDQNPRAQTKVPTGTAVSFTLGIPALTLALFGALAVLLIGVVVFARRPNPAPTPLPPPIVPTIALGLPIPTPVPSVIIAAAKPLVAQTIDVSITAEPPQTSVTVDANVAAATAFVTYGEST
jgi:beta-lactam-binding protein with PASTA domain